MAQRWHQKATVQAALATGVLGIIAALIGIIPLLGQEDEPPVSAMPQMQSPPPQGPEPLAVPRVSDLLFSEARELLLRQGWFPMSNPANPTGNPDLQSGNGPYFAFEKGFREVMSCSGTGLAPCKFGYRSEAGQYLYVVTVGEGANARVNDLWISDEPEP